MRSSRPPTNLTAWSTCASPSERSRQRQPQLPNVALAMIARWRKGYFMSQDAIARCVRAAFTRRSPAPATDTQRDENEVQDTHRYGRKEKEHDDERQDSY